MKKYIYKLITFTLIIGSITSCDSELEQIPFDEFATENAFISVNDFENGIRGVYEALINEDIFAGMYSGDDSGTMLSGPDVLSDNVTLSQDGRQTKSTLHEWRYSPQNPSLSVYSGAYRLIYRANELLFYAETFDGDNKTNVVAEAKALRALAHFNVVSFYGKIPTQSGDANGSLGAAYITGFDPDNPAIEPARETVGETYAQIVADLVEAEADINVSNPDNRLNKQSVNLLLSRVYLYMGEWQNAINAANKVTMPLANRGDVVGVWEDANKKGVLFSIVNDPGGVLDNSIGVTWSQGTRTALTPEYVVSFELYNLFADDDIRKAAYTFQGTASSNAVNGIKKLFGRTGANNGKVDYKIFRAAEAKLNIAEAQFNLGNEGAARTALDEVRTKRYLTPPSGESGTVLRDAIRLERRLEFAFEYQRFFDLKRWGLDIIRGSEGDHADGSGTPSATLTLLAGDIKFQLPISQNTIDRNPNTAQNPGY